MILRNISIATGNVLFNGFDSDIKKEDRSKKFSTTLQHFNPLTKWMPFENLGSTLDLTINQKYLYQTDSTLRAKCTVLFFSTLVIQTFGLLLNIINRIVKLVVLAHLWVPSPNEYSFKARVSEMGKDFIRVVASPLILLGLLLASAYGVIRPMDGAKIYASLERFAYGGGYHRFAIRSDNDVQSCFVAICFQPEPVAHLGGSPIYKPDGW